jgi:2'-5' RNA ligase
MTRSAVLVEVPPAEPVVGRWRRRHTYDAPLGIPAHVTLLFPFIPVERLSESDEARLAALIAAEPAFDASFPRMARWPGVLYLEPQPPQPFLALTEAIATAWPEHPPYEGAHDQVVPHLTVAESEDESLRAHIAKDVEPRLPVELRVREAQLYFEDGAGRWHERRRFPLGE